MGIQKSKKFLNGNWLLRGFDEEHGRPEDWLNLGSTRGFIPATVPGEVHTDLEKEGLIRDMTIGTQVREARWVEENVWLYRKDFSFNPATNPDRQFLVFEYLDLNAQVYLNGKKIGSHHNVYTPAEFEITAHLQEENRLEVIIEGGIFDELDRPARTYQPAHFHPWSRHKRHWSRKPQNVYGWDWNPHLITVGICGAVYLEARNTVHISAVSIAHEVSPDLQQADGEVRIHLQQHLTEARPDISIRLRIGQTCFSTEHKPDRPEETVTIPFTINQPDLWWPRGHGEQNLTKLSIEIHAGDQLIAEHQTVTGFRRFEVDRTPHTDGSERFTFIVNNRPIFAKGANWVPVDFIYSRVTPEKEKERLRQACAANFNFMRVWGGAHYVSDTFMQECDRLGIMVWHDFIFACISYPGDIPEFYEALKPEITHQVRRLSKHPSLLVWCGNNELELGISDYSKEPPHPDHDIFYKLIPEIIDREDAGRFYWPTSPWSGSTELAANHPSRGDQHAWDFPILSENLNFHIYRNDPSSFVDEGGALGASCWKTLCEFLPESERHLDSPSWYMHDNLLNYLNRSNHCEELVKYWLGVDPCELPLKEYAEQSALLQAEALTEFIINFRRRAYKSSAVAFWMFADAWPSSYGWTIIDYYGRRKACFHPVRRAFEPVTVAVVSEGEKVIVFGINDSPFEWNGTLHYGIFRLDRIASQNKTAVTIPPCSSLPLAEISRQEWEQAGLTRSGAFARLLDDNGVQTAQHRLFEKRFAELHWPNERPNLKIKTDETGWSTLESDRFICDLMLDPDSETDISDDCFDLLPGIPYRVRYAPTPAGLKAITCMSPQRPDIICVENKQPEIPALFGR